MTSFWFRETRTGDSTSALQRTFSFGSLNEALRRPRIGFLLILMFFYQVAFGGYEQLFSLFTLTRLGMDARDTSGLFVLAGLFIVVVQAGFVGRWSKQKGDRWLVILGVSTLAIGLIGTALTPAIPIPWYEQAKVMESLAGEGAIRVRQGAAGRGGAASARVPRRLRAAGEPGSEWTLPLTARAGTIGA